MLRENIFNSIKVFGCICIFIIFVHNVGVHGYETLRLMQERAIVKFADPAYITDVKVFTSRRRRSDPYMTNITATIHQTWGNNVTSKISYVLPTGNTIDLSNRICDAVNLPWMLDFVKLYSNLTECPLQAGTYRYFNIVIPPKNFPLPLPPGLKKGDTSKINIYMLKTANKQTILEIYGTARVY